MRITVVTLNINTKNGGGAHLTLDLLLKFLVQKGHNVSLVASTIIMGDEKPPYKIIQEKIEGGFIETVNQVEKILKKYEDNSDLYLIYGASLIGGAGKYKKNNGLKPVASYVNSYIPSLGIVKPDLQYLNIFKKVFSYLKFKIHFLKHLIWEKLFGLKLANLMDLIIFDSPSILKIYENFGYPKDKLVVEPELIDTEKILKISETIKTPNHSGVKFLYVGRLIYDKGVDLLIEATHLIKNKKDFSIDIVGKGDQLNYLNNLIKKYQLENQIKIYPWQTQEELFKFYKNADVFIHPGRWPEPFGRTIIEIMSIGKPVITSNTGGTVFAMGEGGITFKPNSAKDLSLSMEKFINDKDLINNLSKKAKEQSKLFDYKNIAPRIENRLINLVK